MKVKITHEEQNRLWDEEHKNPFVLPPMDSRKPSSGIVLFWEWLQQQIPQPTGLKTLEIGCGKGRNSLWLADQGLNVDAFDFSGVAIQEAIKRAEESPPSGHVHFFRHDAKDALPFDSNTIDIAIDVFATTDIESKAIRRFAQDELIRTLKPGGFLFLYLLSVDDEFHNEMIKTSPGEEDNSFLHPTTGKFEKAFDRDEIMMDYKALKLLEERRIDKKALFFEKEYTCRHFWMVFQKQG